MYAQDCYSSCVTIFNIEIYVVNLIKNDNILETYYLKDRQFLLSHCIYWVI